MTTPNADDSRLEALAEQHGTPLYVYDREVIESRYELLSRALSGLDAMICYAVKANSNISILALMKELGAGFDIVSEGELHRALTAGADPSKIVFSGVGKRESEIALALESGILFFNVESASELDTIETRAASQGKKARVAFRINPDISVDTHPYLSTGVRSSKFGLPPVEAWALANRALQSKHLEVCGVDCHIGSQIHEIDALKEAYNEVLSMARELRSAGHPVRYLDLGGGLGISYSGHYVPLDVAAFGRMLTGMGIDEDLEIILEPGKFLIAESGSLLTRVIVVKENEGKRFAVVDAGMNDLIRPALYEAFHRIDLLSATRPATGAYDVVGPVCESGCYLAKDRELPELQAGDLLAIRDAGAYCFSMASTYNSRRLPAEVLVSSTESRLIRRRDSYEDLWRNEIF